jgi:hypothetical protein
VIGNVGDVGEELERDESIWEGETFAVTRADVSLEGWTVTDEGGNTITEQEFWGDIDRRMDALAGILFLVWERQQNSGGN